MRMQDGLQRSPFVTIFASPPFEAHSAGIMQGACSAHRQWVGGHGGDKHGRRDGGGLEAGLHQVAAQLPLRAVLRVAAACQTQRLHAGEQTRLSADSQQANRQNIYSTQAGTAGRSTPTESGLQADFTSLVCLVGVTLLPHEGGLMTPQQQKHHSGA